MLIHLIRHTTPAIEEGICYGQTDLDLADSSEQERNMVLSKLLDKYDAVYTSPLQRCSRLARHIKCNQPVIEEPRIMEYNFGDWELRPWAEFKSQAAQDWMNNIVEQPAPNGDSIISMQARVLDFWQDLLTKPYAEVAVVTHSGVQRLIHAHILESPTSHLFRLQLAFGAVIAIKHDPNTGLLTLEHK